MKRDLLWPTGLPERSEGPRLLLCDHTNLCEIASGCEVPRRLCGSG
jgi:hypothetical protein